MLDRDLAALYEVDVKVLNQAVKRNSKRFPKRYMFQLAKEEFEELRCQIESSESHNPSRSQIVTLKTGRGSNLKYLPYAFTEQGVGMLSAVLNSEKAVTMSIAIMDAFVAIRRILLEETDLKTQLKAIKERLGEHDVQLNQIYAALENLLDEKAEEKAKQINWQERKRIGFK